MSYQPKNWRWCSYCHRDAVKNGHTPFCPVTTISNDYIEGTIK